MPGSSLWLKSPNSQLNTTLQRLIEDDIPSLFPSDKPPNFIPHITLTSFIPPSIVSPDPSNTAEAQKWLSDLNLPKLDKVNVQQPKVGNIFFQKLTLACDNTDSMQAFAQACRAQATEDTEKEAETWAKDSYYPHLSLMYSGLPSDVVSAKMYVIRTTLLEAQLQSPTVRTAKGGHIVLVPTDQPIEKWEPIAIRELPDLDWEWGL